MEDLGEPLCDEFEPWSDSASLTRIARTEQILRRYQVIGKTIGAVSDYDTFCLGDVPEEIGYDRVHSGHSVFTAECRSGRLNIFLNGNGEIEYWRWG